MYIFNDNQKYLKRIFEKMIKQGLLESTSSYDAFDSFNEILNRLAEENIFGINVPKELGGCNYDTVSQVIILSLIASENPAVAHVLGANLYGFYQSIIDFGTEAQKDIYVMDAQRKRKLGTFAYTEPNGCNFNLMKLRADKVSNGYILNGTKTMVTYASKADFILVFAKTDNSDNIFDNFSVFIVDVKNTDGIIFGKDEKIMGLDGMPINEIKFEDCYLDDKKLLGRKGDGVQILVKQLEKSRIANAAVALGIAETAYKEALKFSKNRCTEKGTLFENPIINQKLALLKVKLETIRLLAYNAAHRCDMGDEKLLYFASIAKYQVAETTKEICDEALQIHGGYGYSKNYAIEQLYRDARLFTIINGTSELILAAIGGMLDFDMN